MIILATGRYFEQVSLNLKFVVDGYGLNPCSPHPNGFNRSRLKNTNGETSF